MCAKSLHLLGRQEVCFMVSEGDKLNARLGGASIIF